MRYIIRDPDDEQVGEGDDVTKLDDSTIPTHGSISIEIQPGYWLNISTNENIFLKFGDKPKGHYS